MSKVVILFRVWPDSPGPSSLVGILPERVISTSADECLCIDRLGVPSPCNADEVISSTIAATPDQYAPLLSIVQAIGWAVDIKPIATVDALRHWRITRERIIRTQISR